MLTEEQMELTVIVLGHDREYLVNTLKEIQAWLGDGPCTSGAGSQGDGQHFKFIIRELERKDK